MALGRLKKTAAEVKRVTFDYSRWLATAETVSARSFTITPTTAPALTVSASSIAGDGKSVTFFVEGGTDDAAYDVIIQITTSDGQVKQDELKVTVNNL